MRARRPDATQRTLALIAAVIVAVNALSLILDPRDRAYLPLFAVDVAHGALALAIAAIASRARRSWSPAVTDLLFVTLSAPFLIGLWLPQSYDLAQGTLHDPLLAHRFLLLGLAISAPSWRSGVITIVLFTVHAVALWAMLTGATSIPALEREPWLTAFYALIAGMLLYTRERRRGLEQKLAASEARTRTLSQVSRVLLALRDRANTPLQTLEVAIAMLEADERRDEALLTLMRRALARLVEIQQTLAVDEVRGVELDVPLDLEAALRDMLKEHDTKETRLP